jgi:glutathione synthase/RimK-type ligase-like ATP-grasp enzyme
MSIGSRRVCFVTCLAWPDISESDGHVARALESRGVAVTSRAWNDPQASFDGFDAVVFRSSWDYHHAPEAYLAWLRRWEAEGVRFWNPPALIRWNLTKRYLLELELAGVPVIPTVVLDDPAAIHLPAVLAERGWSKAVVKPVLGASGHDAALVGLADSGAVAAAIDDGRLRRPVLVQPFIEEVRTRGEWSLVFIDGALTHAMVKRPGSGDFRVQTRYGGTSARAQASPALERAGLRALDALPVAPLYARVDGVETGDGFLVMEVEVHEPGLFFPAAPAAAEAFAEAIIRRL